MVLEVQVDAIRAGERALVAGEGDEAAAAEGDLSN